MPDQAAHTLDRADWAGWLALRRVPGVGNVAYRQLLERFGSPRATLGATLDEVSAAGIGNRIAQDIVRFDDWAAVDAELDKLARLDIRLVLQTDAEYPERLKQIHDPPPFLYVSGGFAPEDTLAVAVVGARQASRYGRDAARSLARALAGCGISVVSGLARGIDGEAHEAALSAGGRTIAVLGSGLDVVYPREHIALAERIAAHGAVVSEFALGSGPHASNFPYRNRVISGMSLGTVVVEASEKSGSLITARCALDQNREVFAVPGPITAQRSRGPHRLIKDGAKLVEGIDDILSEVAPALLQASRSETSPEASGPAVPRVPLTPDEATLFQLVSNEAVHVDALVARSRLETGRVLELLLGMELKGVVLQLPGMYYAARREPAVRRERRIGES